MSFRRSLQSHSSATSYRYQCRMLSGVTIAASSWFSSPTDQHRASRVACQSADIGNCTLAASSREPATCGWAECFDHSRFSTQSFRFVLEPIESGRRTTSRYLVRLSSLAERRIHPDHPTRFFVVLRIRVTSLAGYEAFPLLSKTLSEFRTAAGSPRQSKWPAASWWVGSSRIGAN